jgi:hypothetical protein
MSVSQDFTTLCAECGHYIKPYHLVGPLSVGSCNKPGCSCKRFEWLTDVVYLRDKESLLLRWKAHNVPNL